jgi:hypothetical protein
MKRHHVRKTLLILFGALFIAFGIGAFVGFPGAHDSHHHQVAHNLTHIIAGVLILYVALVGNTGARRSFCFTFGLVYFAIGLVGVFSVKDSLRLVPGLIEFHLEDDWVQMATGALFVLLGLLKSVPSRYPRRGFAT